MSDPKTISAIGRNLRRFRDELGISKPVLSKRAGVSVATISNLELGYSPTTTITTAERLAEALGVTLQDLTRDPSGPFGADSLARLVDEFLASDLNASMPGGPATDDEVEWLRQAPVAYWGGAPPTSASLYHLILARRAARP